MRTSIRFVEGAHAEPPPKPGGEWRLKVADAGSASALDESGKFQMEVTVAQDAPGPVLVTLSAETVGDATRHQLYSYANNEGSPPFWQLSSGNTMIVDAKVVRHDKCTKPFAIVLAGVDTNKNTITVRAGPSPISNHFLTLKPISLYRRPSADQTLSLTQEVLAKLLNRHQNDNPNQAQTDLATGRTKKVRTQLPAMWKRTTGAGVLTG
jgi:hypothetical protein